MCVQTRCQRDCRSAGTTCLACRYLCYILQAFAEGESRLLWRESRAWERKRRADLPMGVLNMIYLLNTITECIDSSAERVSGPLL